MFKELKYVFYLVTIFFFIFFVTRYYFSDSYKKKTYRSLNLVEEKISTFSEKLIVLGLYTVADLLNFFPRDYVDYSKMSVAELKDILKEIAGKGEIKIKKYIRFKVGEGI